MRGSSTYSRVRRQEELNAMVEARSFGPLEIGETINYRSYAGCGGKGSYTVESVQIGAADVAEVEALIVKIGRGEIRWNQKHCQYEA